MSLWSMHDYSILTSGQSTGVLGGAGPPTLSAGPLLVLRVKALGTSLGPPYFDHWLQSN